MKVGDHVHGEACKRRQRRTQAVHR